MQPKARSSNKNPWAIRIASLILAIISVGCTTVDCPLSEQHIKAQKVIEYWENPR